jgi:hypothetical protein
MGIDLFHSGNLLGARHQVLVHPELDLAADAKRRRHEQVERAADRAFGGVFHRHDRKLRRARLAAPERFVDRRGG